MIRSRSFPPLAVAVVIGSVALATPTAVRAGFAVQVYDDGVLQGGITTLVNGNSLIFSGTTTHFSITNGSGLSNNPGATSSILGLSSNEQISTTFGATGGTHNITIVLSQSDWLAPSGSPLTLSSSAGGSLSYATGTNASAAESVSATYQGFLDDTNTLFGQPAAGSSPLQSANASRTSVGTSPLVFSPGTSVNDNVPGGTPFSMTDVLSFTFTLDAGSGQATANASASTTTTVVPEPSTLLLALTGFPLLSIPAWLRLRRRRAEGLPGLAGYLGAAAAMRGT